MFDVKLLLEDEELKSSFLWSPSAAIDYQGLTIAMPLDLGGGFFPYISPRLIVAIICNSTLSHRENR